jgi:hypothetical protein
MEDFDPQTPMTPPEVPAAKGRMLGARRLIATTLLSVGMIAVGGVAIVNAASPAPAASAPAAPGGSGTHAAPANCPNMPNGSTAPAG